MIELLAAIPVSAATSYVTYRALTLKLADKHYLSRMDAHHKSITEKQRGIRNDAKVLNLQTSQHVQDADQMLVAMRQATEKNAELENRCQHLLQTTESLMNDPRVQRAIKSG